MNGLARTVMTLACTDSDSIRKVPEAGKIVERDGQLIQIMHNGIQVLAGGYHGDWMSDIIRGLRGHHEPQEELIFHHLLRYVRQKSVFVELGAFWAYYTNWYLSDVYGARALCIEPDLHNLALGKRNTALNGHTAEFIHACVGGSPLDAHELVQESDGARVTVPRFSMAEVMHAARSPCIEILHMDVQGAELDFLSSMRPFVAAQGVRFLVVSTHHESISGSPTTHQDCLRAIEDMGGTVLCEHSVQESYSGDGLIAASYFACDRSIVLPEISRNTAANSLFPE